MTHRPEESDDEETADLGYDTLNPGVRWNRLGVAVYGVEAGIVSTAIGGWASSGSSGSSRLVVWISVTAALAIGAAWLAEPTVILLTRYLQDRRGRRSLGPRLALAAVTAVAIPAAYEQTEKRGQQSGSGAYANPGRDRCVLHDQVGERCWSGQHQDQCDSDHHDEEGNPDDLLPSVSDVVAELEHRRVPARRQGRFAVRVLG